MTTERIVTFLETLEQDGPQTQRRADLEVVVSTLRLWESCIACHSQEMLETTLRDLKDCPEQVILVLERLSEGLLEIIKNNRPKRFEVLLLIDEQSTPTILGPDLHNAVNHYVSISQGRMATTSLITAIRKISTKEIYGVDKYLTYGTPLHFFVLTRSEDRPWFVERFMDYVSGLEGIIPSGAHEFSRMTGEVLDELLMNAIWDANPRRNSSDRNTPVLLDASEGVKVEWGVDGNILAVGVRDPFGTFEKKTLINYQEDVFGIRKPNQITVNQTGVGAGIGLHMIIRRTSGIVVNSTPDFATEVIALFDLTQTSRLISKGPKTLHFFSG
jgi:hypothetical protein